MLRIPQLTIRSSFDGQPLHPFAEWNARQKSFMKDTSADILIILDCCHSASAIEPVYADQSNVVELLVACSIEGKAPLREKHSLTFKLTELLREKKFWESGFSISYLYSHLVHFQKLRGQVSFDDQDERGITPLRFPILSRREESRSIHIHRRIPPDSEEEESEADSSGSAVRDSPTKPSLGSPAGTTNPLQIRTLGVYSDPATTTIPASSVPSFPPTPPSRASAVVEYVEAPKNTEPVVIAQNKPLPQVWPSTASYIRPQTPNPAYCPLSHICEPSVRWRSRKRKMADDLDIGRHVI